MKLAALLDIAAELLRTFRSTNAPADRVQKDFFLVKKFLGSKERPFVGDAFYHSLRHLRRIDRALVIALEGAPVGNWLSRATGYPCDEMPNDRVWAYPGEAAKRLTREDQWIDRARVGLATVEIRPNLRFEIEEILTSTFPTRDGRFDDEWVPGLGNRLVETFLDLANRKGIVHFAIRRSLPEWILPHFGDGLSANEIDALAAALNESANVCLRVNRLKISRDEFQAQAKEAGVVLQAARLAPDCLTAPGRVRTGDLPGSQEGMFEFQDEGSQLVAHLLGAQPGWTVVDACAGGGGKALQLAAAMENKGKVLAGDASPGRLASLPPRAKRAGATCIKTFGKRSDIPDKSADMVVLDVPCTGTGTWRRSPDLKWRTMREGLRDKMKVQEQLLEEWRGAVRPGGLLAYITCSVLADENSAQIRKFVKAHPEFTIEPPALDKELGIKPTREGFVTLLPHREQTDGFFLCLMRRKA